MTELRALSIARPWSSLIMYGPKRVENRTWFTYYRGLLAIHASQRWDTRAADLANLAGLPPAPRRHPTGYLGTVHLMDVHHARVCSAIDGGLCSPWAEPGCWHWVLALPHALIDPIGAPGRLGLFTPPADIQAICVRLTNTPSSFPSGGGT
jgi:hypothetical protein